MPNSPSAKKSLRKSLKNAERNQLIKKRLHLALKKAKKAIEGKKMEESQEFLRQAGKLLDMAAQKGVLKKNTVSRKKSRLAVFSNKTFKNQAS